MRTSVQPKAAAYDKNHTGQLAKRDKVVLPELSHRFMQTLQNAGGSPDILELNCGHYSLALPPNILFAGLRLKRLLISDQ